MVLGLPVGIFGGGAVVDLFFAEPDGRIRVGPVVCAQMFDGDNVDEIAALANDTDYGLVGSVWTNNLKLAHKLAARVRAGTMGINTHGLAGINAPFGGFKQSGWGREFGKESLDLYLETKTVVAHM